MYIYVLNEETLYATQGFMLFKQSSGIHLMYLFTKKQKEKVNKIPTNTPIETFYHTNSNTTNLYCCSYISKPIYVFVDSYLETQNVC